MIANYAGGEIVLPGDPARVIRPADHPELEALKGQTIITSDGTTLLGADDKAGVAVIMETAVWLMEHPEIAHGPIRLCFTCDEEIGRGVDHLDLAMLGATVCYTLDGQGTGEIDVETFSADVAVLTIQGVNIHPGVAKGRMTNAVRVTASLLDRLPRTRLSPETTDGRDGYLHPYEISGGVAEVRARILLRRFRRSGPRKPGRITRAGCGDHARRVSRSQDRCGDQETVSQYGRGTRQRTLRRLPCRARPAAIRANAKQTIVRGGTDGSRLTELGLPSPNLSTGEHSPHSPL